MVTAILGGSLCDAGCCCSSCVAPTFTGFKNLLFGGDFTTNPWQRGTSFALTSSLAYTADRWQGQAGTGVAATFSRQAGAGIRKAMRMQRNSGNSGAQVVRIAQTVELTNAQNLAGTWLTLSFDAIAGANFSSAGALLTASIWTGTGTSDVSVFTGFTGPVVQSATFALGSADSRYTFSALAPAGTTQFAVVLQYVTSGTAGVSDYVDLLDIQLERGDTATQMERRPVGIELGLCERYYYASGLTLQPGVSFFQAQVTSGNAYNTLTTFPQPLRVIPSITLTNISASAFPAAAGTHIENTFGVFESRTATATAPAGTFSSSVIADAEIS